MIRISFNFRYKLTVFFFKYHLLHESLQLAHVGVWQNKLQVL
jgi:hypothetical protein